MYTVEAQTKRPFFLKKIIIQDRNAEKIVAAEIGVFYTGILSFARVYVCADVHRTKQFLFLHL